MLPLYIDEDSMHRGLVRSLRGAGINILTAREADKLSASDESQLAFAAYNGRTLYSANVADFTRIHAEWLRGGQHHAGIILLADQRTAIGIQIVELLNIMDKLDSPNMRDRLEFLGSRR